MNQLLSIKVTGSPVKDHQLSRSVSQKLALFLFSLLVCNRFICPTVHHLRGNNADRPLLKCEGNLISILAFSSLLGEKRYQ